MTLARTRAVAVLGVSGHVVEVEAHLARGLPGLTLIGLPDTSLSEARDRVKAAVINSGEPWPQHRITVGNLANTTHACYSWLINDFQRFGASMA